MMRFVVVARLPPSRLALADERRWLSGFMGSLGRGFSLGAGIWFGIQSTPTPGAFTIRGHCPTPPMRVRMESPATSHPRESVGPGR